MAEFYLLLHCESDHRGALPEEGEMIEMHYGGGETGHTVRRAATVLLITEVDAEQRDRRVAALEADNAAAHDAAVRRSRKAIASNGERRR